MANTFTTSYPEVWSKYMARNLDAESIALATVDRSVEGDLAKFGDTVNVDKWGNVTANNYAEGSDMSVEDVSVTTASLTLNQKKYFNVLIDDLESAQSHLDLVKGFKKRGMVALAQAMDTRVLSHYADVDSGNILGADGAGIVLTKDNVYEYFVRCRQLLREDNVPMEDLVAIIDPDTEATVLLAPEFIQATAKGDSRVEQATLGKLAGFRVVVSNRISTASNVKNLMFFHPEFISFALRISPDKVKIYDPEKRFGVGIKALAFYGSKVFNATMGVVLKKAAV